MMCDPFMAIDASQSGLQARQHALLRGWGHLMNVHRTCIMAMAALARIRDLHRGPDVFCKLLPVLFEFLRRADRTQKLVPQLVASLDLASNLEPPVTRNMAIGTSRLDAELIVVVNGLLVLLINCITHFVAGRAEFERIGFLHPPIEAAPEQDSPNATENNQGRKRIPPAGAPQHTPNARDESSSRTRLA